MFTIKGRKPYSCLDCPCVHIGANGAWDYCQAMNDMEKYSFQVVEQTERPKWCPIVESASEVKKRWKK